MSHVPPSPAPRRLTAADPLLLWREEGAWVVLGGFVDLFAVRVVDGQPHGRREFILRIGQGHAFFRLPVSGDLGMIAVGGLDTTILAQDAFPVEQTEAWVQALASCRDSGGDDVEPRPTGAGIQELKAGEAVSAAGRQLLWAEVQHGGVRCGARAFTAGQTVALPSGRRLVALDAARLKLSSTVELTPEAFRYALDAFHDHGMAAIGGLLQRRRAHMAELAGRRAELSQAILEDGLADLASVVEPRWQRAGGRGEFSKPAQVVLARAAAHLRVRLHRPSETAIDRDSIKAILAASGLRTRTVLLSYGWWRRDNGPLFGQRGDGALPVALIPGKGGYLEYTPDGTTRPLTDEVAAALAPQAEMLYLTFPPDRLTPSTLMQFALREVAGDPGRMLLLALGAAVLALVGPAASGLLVDAIIPAAARGQLLLLFGGLLAAAFCAASLDLVKALTLLRMEGQVDLRLQSALFDRLLRLPVPFFRRFNTGDLADRLLGVQAIRTALSGSAIASLLGGVFSFVSLAALFFYSAPLALLAMALTTVSLLVVIPLTLAQLRHERSFARLRGGVEGLVLQVITAVGKLRVAGATQRALGHWARTHGEQKRKMMAAQLMAAWQSAFQALFAPMATMAVFIGVAVLAEQAMAEAAKAAVDGEEHAMMSTGAFLAFNAAFGQFVGGLTQAVRALTSVLGVVPMYERARPVIEEETEDSAERQSPGRLQGLMEFSKVSFAYQADAPRVLHDVSFTIRPGSYVALVGPSGGGKSTILRLMMGMDQPTGGNVSFDGRPLNRLNMQELRRQIGVVLQNGRILPGSVLTNILGGEEGTLDQAWEAARMVGLDQDIGAMPMGMHTVLMDGGGTLSGGQRQRLMIARALVRRPRILLLDEATSALDNRTQAIVTDTLGALNITRIVVAHRLSTIEGVDHVLVIDKGRLVQEGTYAELMGKPGVFTELARRQLL